MERWIAYAFASMAFAGFTSVIAKLGLTGISADLGLAIRTCFVFVVPYSEFAALTWKNYVWLGLSGVATAGSWIFYYKAIKQGEVSTVALIDKGSVVVALLLAWWILGEAITPAKLAGAGLIAAGLLVIARG